ncbi:hypothetical protein [Sporomusa sphaeroides]|uniref:Uncharacterized protein n=1 Tax=Sporomusa sphaeroides DSM 2875 TaxID=1337886 RepID=A0ABM9W6Y9_9FIRM|nr:hypothetical protein [Sporomusa sphaeroides]OLS54690.1 hypothetical protein SPSPH_40230 [Sporomusa sphaeroides DSM 2875]CVK20922.1 hypothetical protein SSPH_03594 [Sporomusa sphaeroides DSM 2875]
MINILVVLLTLVLVVILLSPAHLCLLVTLDYFKADFLRTQRSIAMLSLFLLLVLTIKTTILYIPC